MEILQYNADALLLFPLVADGAQDFVGDYTPAAGDAKVFTDKLISTNPTALILGFDSLSELPAQGAQLDENGAGTAEGIVAFTVIISGTVGGGDAAGFFFMRSVTGQAWSNDDQIDINGGTADIATADSTTYDLAATAGLIAILSNGQFAAALSPTEASCAQGHLTIIDSATKAIEDQAVRFRTAGNASAYYAYDPFDAVRLGLTALPSAAADAGGGLPISDAGGLDLDEIKSDTTAILIDTGTTLDGRIPSALVSGRMDSSLDATGFEAAAVDLIWDEVLTGATHNVATSAGRRLRQLEAAFVLHAGTAQAGGSNTITLDTGASSIDDFYNHARVVITEGTGIEQERIIVDYTGSSRVAIVAPVWVTDPDGTSVFEVEPAIAHAETDSRTVEVGLAQAGAAGSITLASTTSSVTDFYKNDVVSIDAGTGQGQERIITAYNGTTKVALISPDWLTNPDSTSEYIVEEALVAVGAMLTGVITDDAAAADAFDNLFQRDIDAVEASAPVHSLATAVLKAVSRVRDNAGTLEVFRTDGTTVHMSQTVTADASLDPIDELTAGV